MPLRALSDLLWRERDLLETLLYRLEVEELVLAAGRTARLPIAAREVEDVLGTIRAAELGRGTQVASVAADLNLPAGASLRQLARRSPPPWDGILADHRTALLALSDEIATITAANREILSTAHHATQEALLSLGEDVGLYDRRDPAPHGAAASSVSDESPWRFV